MSRSTDLLQGTLDLLILRVLDLQPMHGLGVANRIAQVTRGTFLVKPGSLFPALHRLEQQGWIEGQWGESENHRKAKYYALTKTGRAQLARELKAWERVTGAVNRVLEAH